MIEFTLPVLVFGSFSGSFLSQFGFNSILHLLLHLPRVPTEWKSEFGVVKMMAVPTRTYAGGLGNPEDEEVSHH